MAWDSRVSCCDWFQPKPRPAWESYVEVSVAWLDVTSVASLLAPVTHTGYPSAWGINRRVKSVELLERLLIPARYVTKCACFMGNNALWGRTRSGKVSSVQHKKTHSSAYMFVCVLTGFYRNKGLHCKHLTLPILRLLSSKAQGSKYFWKNI